jgi:hypothetical protein
MPDMESQDVNLLDPKITAFICPITNALLEDPVVADDGHSYSRKAIEGWFAECNRREDKVTSPLTRKEMSEDLKDNFNLKKAIREYQEQDAATAGERPAKRQRLGGADKSEEMTPGSSGKDLSQLGDMFAQLDHLRDLLVQTFD